MNEREYGRRIVQILDGGLDLPASASARLQAARNRAIAAQRPVQPSPLTVLADGIALRLAGPSQWLTHVLLPVALLVCGLVGLHYWNASHDGATTEAEELDSRILKGELPIDAYLDHGFQAWLKRSSE